MYDERLRAAYDDQLRQGAEVRAADEVRRDGPLWVARFGDRGHVTYRDLGGLDGQPLVDLVARTVRRFADDPRVSQMEWKTRGHDAPPDLRRVLLDAGLREEPVETVMIGEATSVAAAAPERLPAGVEVVRVDDAPDAVEQVTAAALMQRTVFGGGPSPAEVLQRQVTSGGSAEFWVARVDGEVVCAGRLEVVEGTEFAGLWGGATAPEWRGRGIYRALAAARAASAVRRGVRYLHSDCTDMSRPILERAGLVPVTTTTPFVLDWS